MQQRHVQLHLEFDALSIADIEQHALQDERAFSIEHAHVLIADPDDRAIGADHPVLSGVSLARLGHTVLEQENGFAILRVDQGKPQLGIGFEYRRCDTRDLLDVGTDVVPGALGTGTCAIDGPGQLLYEQLIVEMIRPVERQARVGISKDSTEIAHAAKSYPITADRALRSSLGLNGLPTYRSSRPKP